MKEFKIIFFMCGLLFVKAMEIKGILDVIDTEPPSLLLVTYEGNLTVNNGNELTPTQVKNEPNVTWEAKPDKYYLLIMVDPDPPAPFPLVNHWMIGNIPGNDYHSSMADVIVEYRGSGPPKGTGIHRYIFLVYEQSGKLSFENEKRSTKLSRENRVKFSLKDLVQRHKLGDPISGNYYRAQWDSFVDERQKLLTGELK
ncbi:unnamed protein product [Brassicogethes aeneus]|uniref:Phosphatidylethanolamine-binding protein n=1 Tax=Brassicogethes aeneus TaxID=1431903 RepID=A0A9P0BB04_BRAAE|nr:unnamed protein product [Brassicogethes aeneus]